MTSGSFASVPIDAVWIDRENRQRRELNNLEELASSINRNGLIHPIVIDRDFKLIAGERRITACKALGWTAITAQYADELDDAAMQLIELEENIKRNDMSWKDICSAITKYHKLMTESEEGWTLQNTADAMSMSKTSVSEYILVQTAIAKGDERVAAADKYSVAKGIANRTESRKKASTIDNVLATVDRAFAPKDEPYVPPTPSKPVVPLLNADFHEWAAAYSGRPFNFLHCDFPYGVDADGHNQGQAQAMGGYADSFQVYSNLIDTLEMSMSNVVADSAHMMFWFSMDYYALTKERLEKMGWKVNAFPLIWFKNDNTGILPDPSRGGRRVYETAFHCSRGDRLIVKAKGNAFAHPGRDKDIHMSEKPVPMLRHFMEMYVDEYTIALDPTCGSGNACKAASGLGAPTVLGIERDPEFYGRSVEAYFGAPDL